MRIYLLLLLLLAGCCGCGKPTKYPTTPAYRINYYSGGEIVKTWECATIYYITEGRIEFRDASNGQLLDVSGAFVCEEL